MPPIGVDDINLREGQTYYIVIYGGSASHLLTLFDGWDGEALKEWLKEHPKVPQNMKKNWNYATG